MIVECKCKLCGLALLLEADDQCEPDWLKVFMVMVTCNRCFDSRELRNEITGKIYECCRYLVALDLFTIKEADKKAKRTKVREGLCIHTKRYARWFRQAIGGRTEVWSEDFVDLLMEHPDKADVMLKQYRDGARREVIGQREELYQ